MDIEKSSKKDLTTSTAVAASSSEPSLLKAKPVNFKPDRDILPEKSGSRITRHLKFSFLSTYRKIFTFIFTANMIAFVALVAKRRGAPTLQDVASASSANLMGAVLFRQENFVNLCYEIAVHMPHALPLAIRRRMAKVFHYGGAHSGSGTAAVVWYILYAALITRAWIRNPEGSNLVNLVLSYVILAMFFTILACAHPRFRVLFHDYFEAFHRFAGWTTLIVFWVHNCLSFKAFAEVEGVSTRHYLVRAPNFWFFVISTSCTLLSWSRLRYHSVYPEALSDHAVRLHFKYMPMAPFYGVKISTKPLLEWHAFATIPDEDENGKINGFSVVVSNAGDWTRQTISNPPSKLWIRGYPLHGLLYTSRLFKRVVIVATGSGIGPCLSLLYADVTPRRVLWSTQHPEQTYGPKVIDAVVKADPDAVIWNTRTLGRPDMVALTYQLVVQSNAEAVFIISNPKVTRKVVYGMESRGIPAYGAIFDS
ncbi:hypothetical protein CPB83DRAFT_886210 [Crepidotus variabilis]|uniref:Nonribosomal peptide synthetase 12 n=1 Tax=Crepidotus variabilis TaxID=179855 RepID=A0A9P6E8Q1_9AGAR|nr:hypothetical protein CPB83DRAFT_886210 [Crepidotus variabilis]